MDVQFMTCEVGGRTVVAVAGEVVVATAPQLREHLDHLIAHGHHHLVIDLAAVEFMDSTGLAVLLEVLNRVCAQNGSLRLVCTREPILKIARITGLDQVFQIYDDVYGAALAAGDCRAGLAIAGSAAQEPAPVAEQDAGVA